MGLLSSVKKATGLIKNKGGSAIGSLKAKGSKFVEKAKTAKFIGGAAKLVRPALKVGKFAAKRAGVIGLGITAGSLAYGVGKKIFKKKGTTATPTQLERPEKKSLGSKIVKAGAIAAGVGGGLYIAEQIAEKLGVRGGAGFIGKRKKKKTTKSRRKRTLKGYHRKPRHGTKAWMSYIRGMRGATSSLRFRKKRGRRGRGVSKTELRQIKALIRRSERD